MLQFFKKPFVYCVCFFLILAGVMTWTILDVFVYEDVLTPADDEENITRPILTGAATLPPLPPDLVPETSAPKVTAPPETDEFGVTVEPSTTVEEPNITPTYPIITDNYYRDENICITIETIRRYNEDGVGTNYHVANIWLTSPDLLKTAIATDIIDDLEGTTARVKAQADAVGAILAVNGDYYSANDRGYVMRNGKIYRSSARNDKDARFEDLAIHYDGSFHPFYEKDISLSELRDQGYYNVLAFGPTLVRDGKVAVDVDEEVGITNAGMTHNPRTAIGVVSDLHYVIVCADGRTDESLGATLYEFANVLVEVGCTYAYNLDGGGSTTMYFNGKIINNPVTNWNKPYERSVSDIVYIGYN